MIFLILVSFGIPLVSSEKAIPALTESRQKPQKNDPLSISLAASPEAEMEIPVVRLIVNFLVLCLALGAADALVKLTYSLAGKARQAHEADQISYSRFTKSLWQSKP